MIDIVFASGAVHDEFGPITSFAPMTSAGRAWLEAAGSTDGSYMIETEMEALTIQCIEQDGLTVTAA